MGYFLQISKSVLNPCYGEKSAQPLLWREENDSYVITAYFKDPSQICSRMPSHARYIGDRLLILNSTTSQDFFQVPLLEDRLSKSAWIEGKCFWTMGKLLTLTLKGPLRTDSVPFYSCLVLGCTNQCFPFSITWEHSIANTQCVL